LMSCTRLMMKLISRKLSFNTKKKRRRKKIQMMKKKFCLKKKM